MWALIATKPLVNLEFIVQQKGSVALNNKDKNKWTSVQFLGKYGVKGDARATITFF
jgi:hypothetical protein